MAKMRPVKPYKCDKCSRRFNEGYSLTEHGSRKHPRLQRRRTAPRRFCRGLHGGTMKRYFGSLTDAWVAAFLAFHARGDIVTPYKCATKREALPIQVLRQHPDNPWAWDTSVVGVKLSPHMRTLQSHCNGFHLTRKTDFILTSAQ